MAAPIKQKTQALKRKVLRVGAFVDTQNLYHSAKNLYKAKVNFKAVLKAVTDGRELVRAFAYVVRTESGEEKGFIDALEKAGYEIKAKDLQIFPGGFKKGDWDVGIAVDAIRLSDNLDVIIVVSGDGDFRPLVEFLQFKGKIVEVAGFRKSTSAKIIEEADFFHDLEVGVNKYLIK
jgi:uncharacterized LabA/DUF88 family protein